MTARKHPPAKTPTGCWAACSAIGSFASEFHGDIAANCPAGGACMARRLLDQAAQLPQDALDRPTPGAARRA